jgi:hypothetical protein
MPMEFDAKTVERVASHMNADHGDSMLAWVHYYAELPEAQSARITTITAAGWGLEVGFADGKVKSVTVPFDREMKGPADLRKSAVAMHMEAFHGLGYMYKLKNGYYPNAANMAWTHMPKKVKTGLIVGVPVVLALGIFAARRRVSKM